MNMKKILIAFLLPLLLVACSGKGSEFVGKWQMTTEDQNGFAPKVFEIKKDGDGFRITGDGTNYQNLALQPDGTLLMPSSQIAFSYSKSDDEITAFFKHYKRL